MLLHFIFITFVVCTAEISEFHTFFLCLSRPLEKFSLVSFDACNNFSLSFVVVSLSMPKIRGSCGHLKGSYDNHSSCLNCSGCFRSNLLGVPLLVRLDLVFGWKASAFPRQANGQDKGCESEGTEEFRL